MFFQIFPEYIFPFLYGSLVAISVFSVSLRIFLKYRERKNIPLLYLSLAYFCYSGAVLVADLGFFYKIFFGSPDRPHFILALFTAWYLSLAIVIIGNWFYFAFAQELFSVENSLIRGVLAVFSLVGVVILLLGGLIELGSMKFVLALLLSVPVYFYIMYSSFKAWKASSDIVYIRRFQFIFLSGIFLFFIFILFLFDALTGRYTVFYYLGWLMVILSSITSYYGYVPPVPPNSQSSSK
ncbi:MAG: hypothetical protein ACFFBD_21020 [Candidatus Hodarchaeota archaeon]